MAMLKRYTVVRIEVASCSNFNVELFFKLMALYLLTQCSPTATSHGGASRKREKTIEIG